MTGSGDVPHAVGGVYDAIAQAYAERKLRRGVEPYVHQMLDALTDASTSPLGPGAVVADVGCGIGLELGALAARGWRPLGIDASGALLAHARAAAAHSLVQADVCALPLAAGCLDSLVAIHALVHLCEDAVGVALAEMRRGLRPGACAAVSVLTGQGTTTEEVSYAPGQWRTFSSWTPTALAEVATRVGLHPARVGATPAAGGTTWVVLRRRPG